ncbi:monocarboxylate transporter 9-like [Achroia grisella]|uniref:monocarboxylate transporter 9-like n=1 Tax=Achroia grisella TaxID=688607 RepID=UPI0027D24660|nr:monocarboxylate transporter 9-like [Achroia grisella]XP_059062062.1 monocarboxylate transporter 9-like [Achroia grisella]
MSEEKKLTNATSGTDSHDDSHDEEIKDMNKINSLKSESKEIVAHYTKVNDSPPVERVKFEGLDDKDSICSDDSDDEKPPPIPDGGWGWVVVASAFLVSACADGLAFSFGLLHEEFTQYFETTQSKTSLIGSLFIATPLLAGPVMSALVDRYGCRIMTMIAGVMSTIGFLLAAFSNSVEMLCLTFGFISGLAMGILYVTAVVSVAFWFDKKRNLAVSLASCGIGFGTLIYSPMTAYFLEVYDWRNTIVLLAGTLLNMCVCGAVMRNPEWLEIKQKRERRLSKSRSRRSSSAGSISSKSLGGESVYLDAEELKSLLSSGKSPEYILATLAETIAEAEKLETTTQLNAEPIYRRMHSAIHLPTFIQGREKVPPEVIEKLMANKQLYNIILENYPDLLARRRSEMNINVDAPAEEISNEAQKLPVQIKIKVESKSKTEVNKEEIKTDGANAKPKDISKSNAAEESRHHHHHKHKEKSQPTSHSTNWIARQISTDHHYLKDMPLYRNTIMYRGAMMNIPRYRLKTSSLPDIYRNSMWSIGSESDDEMKWYHRLWETLKTTFDFRMFTEFHFLMFNLSSLILSVWFIVPYFFLKSYMTAMNIEGGPMMTSIIGIASSIGIVGLGWAGDQPWVHVIKTYAICLTICGLSVAAYPMFITNYWALTVISAIFGLSFASSYSYTPAILMELIPIDQFTIAYGLILLSQGIGHLVGPPIGGLLYDLTGSWDMTFYIGGLWIVISGLCVGVIAYTKNARMCGTAPLLKEIEESEKNGSSIDV